jgi:hypothetical protein
VSEVGKVRRASKKLPRLPAGIQSFDKIRENGYLYVDKTRYLVDLIDDGAAVYFLSRPRRFGKSLTVSTFDAMFSGRRELFGGLAAEEYMNRADYKPGPVILLDMSLADMSGGRDDFDGSIVDMLQASAERYGVEIGRESPARSFSALIRALHRAEGPVAILIDEYDRPMLEYVGEPEKAEEVRALLRSFYLQIKGNDRFLRFVFMTGVTKFSRMGVFSALNNLTDISSDDRYAAMLGYTEEELLLNFGGHVRAAAEALGQSEEAFIDAMRSYYDGFSFDGRTRLYNPFSTLSLFREGEFKNYWYDTATPSYLAEYVRRHDLEAEQFRGLVVHEDFTSYADIDQSPPESWLFQAGYLTIREKRGGRITLDYPNMEAREATSELFLRCKSMPAASELNGQGEGLPKE